MAGRFSVASKVLPSRLQDALRSMDILDAKLLATFDDLPDDGYDAFMIDLGYVHGELDFPLHRGLLVDLIKAAAPAAAQARRVLGARSATAHGILVAEATAARSALAAPAAADPVAPALPIFVPLPALVRRGAKRELEAPAVLHHARDNSARGVLVVRLRGIVSRLNVQENYGISCSTDLRGSLVGCAQGARASTLRKRLHGWSGIQAWCLATTGQPWPTQISFTEYLVSRAAEPCGRSVLKATVLALKFLEKACSISPSEQLGTSSAISNLMKELEVQVAGATPDAVIRQAPQIPIALLLALELAVEDEEVPLYLRGVAWVRLLKWWASMRFSDVQWVSPSSFRSGPLGLTGTISRTKTTGLGKRILAQAFTVSSQAWLATPTWLESGLLIWGRMGHERDYMLPCPTDDRRGARQVLAEYRDSAAVSQELMTYLRVPVYANVPGMDGLASLAWSPGDTPLLLPGSGAYWTEHSERNGLISLAALAGFRQEEVKVLGRWSPTSSEAYIRTAQVIVERVQSFVASQVRSSFLGPDVFGEHHLLGSFEVHLIAAGWEESVVESAVGHLRLFGSSPGRFLAASAPPAFSEVLTPTDVATIASDISDVEESGIPALGDYYVTLPAKGRRRLHVLGDCSLRPGISCGRFASYGSALPAAHEYDDKCRRCWKTTKSISDALQEVAGSFSATSSASSSSSSAEELS